MEQPHRDSRDWLDMLGVVIRLGLGCLFVWSSLSKIQLPHEFLGHVYAYRFVGPVTGMFVAMVLPWLEMLVGACLLGGIFIKGALLACVGMAVMFVTAIGWALHLGLNINCGCFGWDEALIGYGTLVRGIIILIASGLAYVVELHAQQDVPTSPPWRQYWRSLRRSLWVGTDAGGSPAITGQGESPEGLGG